MRRSGAAWASTAGAAVLLLGGALACASAAPGREPEPVAAQAVAPAPAVRDAAPDQTPQDELPSSTQTQQPVDDPDDALIASIQQGPYDPLEPMNRSFFAFNRGVDYVLVDPVTSAYEYVVPAEGRRAVRRVFRNLDSARTLANDILQLKFRDALVTTARFAINSTLGLGGLFDPATNFGLQRHEADFGETLAQVGVGAGPYLVLPLFGPTTFRDGIGTAVDGFLQPQFWLLGPGSRLLLDSSDGLSLRDEHKDDLRHLRDSSVDYYAALRSAYLLDREGEIRGRLEKPELAPLATPSDPGSPPASEPAAAPNAPEGSQAETGATPAVPSALGGAEAAALLKPGP